MLLLDGFLLLLQMLFYLWIELVRVILSRHTHHHDTSSYLSVLLPQFLPLQLLGLSLLFIVFLLPVSHHLIVERFTGRFVVAVQECLTVVDNLKHHLLSVDKT